MPIMELEPAATSIPKKKPEGPADQVSEPAITSVSVGGLVELDTEEWLIDLETVVVIPANLLCHWSLPAPVLVSLFLAHSLHCHQSHPASRVFVITYLTLHRKLFFITSLILHR